MTDDDKSDVPDEALEDLEDLDTEEEGNVIEDLDEAAADFLNRGPVTEPHDDEVLDDPVDEEEI